MNRRFASSLLVAVTLLIFSSSVSAHHGNAAYDFKATKTLKGFVADWKWTNPHCLLKLDTTDEQGGRTHWVLETGGVADMEHAGWSAITFKPGDEITVDIMPTKNGAPVGRIRRVILANGKELIGIGRSSL
jgi:hypothetical protein